jgi:hypothetical protein
MARKGLAGCSDRGRFQVDMVAAFPGSPPPHKRDRLLVEAYPFIDAFALRRGKALMEGAASLIDLGER